MSEPPPFLPFTDEEGYYARNPKAVFNRADDGFRVFDEHLESLKADFEKFEKASPAEQQAIISQMKEKLGLVQSDIKPLLAFMRELVSYNVGLTEQRQSAREAFELGWKTRYKEILSQLHPEDHRMLRWIVERLGRE